MGSSRGGRPSGRPLTDLELEHLQFIHDLCGAMRGYLSAYEQEREDFVLRLRDTGASVRGLAEVLGVSSATIHTWTMNARRRRDSSG